MRYVSFLIACLLWPFCGMIADINDMKGYRCAFVFRHDFGWNLCRPGSSACPENIITIPGCRRVFVTMAFTAEDAASWLDVYSGEHNDGLATNAVVVRNRTSGFPPARARRMVTAGRLASRE